MKKETKDSLARIAAIPFTYVSQLVAVSIVMPMIGIETKGFFAYATITAVISCSYFAFAFCGAVLLGLIEELTKKEQ